MLGTILCPTTTAIGKEGLDSIDTELVVDHAAEGDAVAEELQGCDRSAPDGHGGEDEEDVFEDTAESHDEGGRFANLVGEEN